MRLLLRSDEGRDGGGGFHLGGYILREDKTPEEVDTMTWALWLETQRQLQREGKPNLWSVGHTRIVGYGYVSTVFLGLDHGFSRLVGGQGRPVLFETMSFGPRVRRLRPLVVNGIELQRRNTGHRHSDVQVRYCTWEEAEAGHLAIVKGIRRKRLKISQARRAGDKRRLERLLHFVTEGLGAYA